MKLSAKREDHSWGAMTWLADGDGLGVTLAKMVVHAGMTSLAHRHDNCDEILHVDEGEISQRCGDAWIKLRAGETVTAQMGVVHQTRNEGERDAHLTICYTSGNRHYEEVSV